jgi:tRNA-Thr(GGU) m(6)t(6)A37 methyltransferase TsaA
MEQITVIPIGVVRSPYKQTENMPVQGVFKPEVTAWIELKEEYRDGLKDLGRFSHAILIYYFHQSHQELIQASPFLEDEKHGIFAVRSPYRPNHLGLSVVRILGIEENRLYFGDVDVLDQTPVLDIKPYVKYFDIRDNVISGWLDKHFEGGKVPDRAILK